MILPFQNIFFKKTADDIVSQQLLRAIQLSRNEAMMRGAKVTLCPSLNKNHCGGEWRDGYLIHTDQKILFTFKNAGTIADLHWRAFPRNRTELQFLPNGATHSENGTFWYCDHASVRWAIVVSQSGRSRMVWPDKYGKVDVNVMC